jgi:hypothetical protein
VGAAGTVHAQVTKVRDTFYSIVWLWRAIARERQMAQRRKAEVEQEPMGIVISRGSRGEQTPRFTAYVWGPAPEAEKDTSEEMVAA